MGTFIDLAGERFGRLRVIGQVENRGSLVQWHCACDCGRETTATTKKLRGGRKNSCGCLWLPAIVQAKTKHGHSAGGSVSGELGTWMTMRARCNNPAHRAFDKYGGRGIVVCERWDDFANFYSDMGPRPTIAHTLDRRDNDGNYEPDNCRWATKREQAQNTSRNVNVSYGGQMMCAAEAARRCGISINALLWRIHAGWSQDRLFSPVGR